jgi:hypothetical protein
MTVRYTDQVLDEYGRPVPGALIDVFDTTRNRAALTDDGGLTMANPTATDTWGNFYFNTIDGQYQLVVHFDEEVRYEETIYLGTAILPALDGNHGDITVSGSGVNWQITPGVITSADIGAGAITTANLADGSVTLAKQAFMATASVVYRKNAGTGPPEVNSLATLKTDLGLSGTNTGDQFQSILNNMLIGNVAGNNQPAIALLSSQATSILDIFTANLKGLAPPSGGGAVNFLCADGTWKVPPGSGGGGSATWGNITGAIDSQGDLMNLFATANVTVNGGFQTLSNVVCQATMIILSGNPSSNATLFFGSQSQGYYNKLYTFYNQTGGAFTVTLSPCYNGAANTFVIPQGACVTLYLYWNKWYFPAASLGSPAFTGTPTAPTPNAFDNSTSLATTNFVQNSFSVTTVGGLAGGSATLTTGQAATSVIILAGALTSNLVVNFGSGAVAFWNRTYVVVNNCTGAFTVTLQACASGAINSVSVQRGTTAFVYTNGGSILLANQAANQQVFDTAAKGVVPISPGGTVSFLRADGQWMPPGSPNVQTVTSAPNVAPDFSNNVVSVNAQAAPLNLANWTGTPVDGWRLVVRIKDNGIAQSLSYAANYRAAANVTLPKLTTPGKVTVLDCLYNGPDSVIDVINTGSGSGSGGGGGETPLALSAPTLGAPTPNSRKGRGRTKAPMPKSSTTIPIALGADWQSGNTLKVARSTSANMSSPVILSHVLTDADITSGTIAIGLPTLSGINYFQAYGNNGADSSNLSNIVAWGSATAPTITTAAAQANTETMLLGVALTATDPEGIPAVVSDGLRPGWFILAGPDALQYQITIAGGVPTLQWSNNGAKSYSAPTDANGDNAYVVIVGAIDYGGNAASLTITTTVAAADITPDNFSFTAVANATISTLYTAAETVTISGLGTGINAPVSVANGLSYSKNGGPYVTTATTAQNGDTFKVQLTSSASYSTGISGALTVGTFTANYTVTTQANPAAANFILSSTQAAHIDNAYSSATYSFTGIDFVVGGLGVVFFAMPNDARTITSITIVGAGASGANIVLTPQKVAGAGNPMAVYTCPNGSPIVNGTARTVTVVVSGAASVGGIITGTLTNSSSVTPTSSSELDFTGSTATPITLPSVTVPSAGVGVCFFCVNSGGPYTAGTGTLIGSYTDQFASGTHGAATRQITAGSWIPNLAYAGGQSTNGALALTWSH